MLKKGTLVKFGVDPYAMEGEQFDCYTDKLGVIVGYDAALSLRKDKECYSVYVQGRNETIGDNRGGFEVINEA